MPRSTRPSGSSYGIYLKQGVAANPLEAETIQPLLRFRTSTHPEGWSSLEEVAARGRPARRPDGRVEDPGRPVLRRRAAVEIEILPDAESVARRGAALVAAEARAAVAARGMFIVAVSGGSTPWRMLRALAGEEVPWEGVHVVQVDERVAPPGHPDRNLSRLRESLLAQAPLRPERIHAMPVESPDLEAASGQYARTLREVAGSPPVLDLVQVLGLGADGHTASLVPGDPVLGATDRDVAPTGVNQGKRRMTLTYPAINRSRRILWLVTGSEKAGMLPRLRNADPSIPAGRVRREGALVIADRAAGSPGGPRR